MHKNSYCKKLKDSILKGVQCPVINLLIDIKSPIYIRVQKRLSYDNDRHFKQLFPFYGRPEQYKEKDYFEKVSPRLFFSFLFYIVDDFNFNFSITDRVLKLVYLINAALQFLILIKKHLFSYAYYRVFICSLSDVFN